VSIGTNVYVGEGSVLDIGTGMGDGAQLGHRSALLPGQRVPQGRSYHGSPAEETTTTFRTVEPMPCRMTRRLLYPAVLLANSLLIYLPATVIAGYELFDASPGVRTISVFPDVLLMSLAGYFGVLALGLAFIVAVPRVLNLFLEPEKTYPLYGLHYLLFRYIQVLTNARAYSVLFGDSSYIVPYLRWIGYELNRVEQTGTNFGTFNIHDTPFLCDVGSGTMASDGLSMMNAHISSSSFRLSKCSIGARNYLGNDVIVPPGARTGDNCLLGTKVMVPIDGPVRENTGLLGSPAFEIPRATNRDTRLAVKCEAQRAELLRKKNAANLRTIAAHLFFRWAFYFIAAIAAVYIWQGYKSFGMPVLVAGSLAFAVFTVGYLILLERLSLGFKRLEPVTCSIYDPSFWRVEHYWKVSESELRGMFRGTPFKNLVSRLLGVKLGRMVFDDGAQATERTLVEIGDYCTLNEGTTLQSHSLEEGVFKCDHIRLGTGCTIGTKAYVHYGTTIGEHAVVEADSFLMKGEAPAPGSIWAGNPARLVRC
jgi:non-ribosomal peptide synthetase-like protein